MGHHADRSRTDKSALSLMDYGLFLYLSNWVFLNLGVPELSPNKFLVAFSEGVTGIG